MKEVRQKMLRIVYFQRLVPNHWMLAVAGTEWTGTLIDPQPSESYWIVPDTEEDKDLLKDFTGSAYEQIKIDNSLDSQRILRLSGPVQVRWFRT